MQSHDSQVTKMADEQALCVGCGKSTVTRQRRILSSESSGLIMEDLHRILCKRIGRDFDRAVLNNLFVCVKCFTAYNTYQRKGKEPFENTFASGEHLEQLLLLNDPLTQSRKRDELEMSKVHQWHPHLQFQYVIILLHL